MAGNEHNRWRPAYESYAAFMWFGVAVASGISLRLQLLPENVLVLTAPLSAALGLYRLAQAIQVWRHRFALDGRGVEWITGDELGRKMRARPDHVWLGRGFEWTRIHTQRLYELEKLDVRRLRVPAAALVRRLLRRSTPRKGSPLLHGVEPVEHDIYVPIAELQGHIFVPATTRAIKTRFLALLAAQAIRRVPHEAVVVIDPKGDRDLRDLIAAECRVAGRDFGYFHPAFPAESIRIDPLANWTRTTEVASRIAALIPSESGHDPWSAFGWRVTHLIAEAYIATHSERPTLTTIRRYVEGGVDQLLHDTLVRRFEQEGLDWRTAIEPYLRQVARYNRPSPTTPNETVALVAYYLSERQQPQSIGPLDGLISMYQHNREHAQKMLASLAVLLTILTAGDLAGLLSPDRNDPTDTRPILNGASIVDSGAVVYLGLDALSDAVVSSAIASIVMADLTAHAGARFNLGVSLPRVNIFVDEACEAVNVPFVQLLNKGAGAGYMVVFLSQTYSDFVAKLGSEAVARQILGNANSVVAGRTKDGLTAKYVMEDFGKTILTSVQRHRGTNTVVAGEILNYSGSYGERTSEALSEIVPPEALGRLPDLEYFASFSGSRIVKGRIPLIRSP